jgi:hypothetical protein
LFFTLLALTHLCSYPSGPSALRNWFSTF